MPIMGANTDSIAEAAVRRLKADQGPIVEAAAKVEGFTARMDDVEVIAADVDSRINVVEPIVTNLATREFDIRAFGAVGTSNDAPTFQAAIDDVAANGGGTITGPAGYYTFTQGIQLRHGVAIAFPSSASTTLDFTAVTSLTSIGASCIRAEGALTPLGTVATLAARQSFSIQLSAAPTLQPGDWVVVWNSTARSFMTERPDYRDGEYLQVLSVSGTTVNFATATFAAYPGDGTVNVYKMEPLSTGISGVTILLPGILSGARFSLANRLVLNDVRMRNGGTNHVYLDRCVNISIDGLDTWSAVAPTGNNYGISVGNSQNIVVANSTLWSPRHGFMTGGTTADGSVPNRNIIVANCTIGGTRPDSAVVGCDTHANTEYVDFQNCAMPTGLHLAGDHIRVHGGYVMSGPQGVAIQLAHNKGYDFDIDTRVIATKNIDTAYPALVYVSGYGVTSSSDGQVECVSGGTFRLNGDIEMGAYRATGGTTRAIYFDRTGATATNADIEIGATVTFGNTGAAEKRLALEVASTGTNFRSVNLQHMKCFGGSIQVDAADTATVESCKVKDPGTFQGIFLSNKCIRQIVQGNDVEGAGVNGIYMYGAGTATAKSMAICHDNVVTDCNTTNGTPSTSGAAIRLFNHKSASYRGNVTNDTRTTPLHGYVAAWNTIGTLRYEVPSHLGGVVMTDGIDPEIPWVYISSVSTRTKV